MRNIGIGTEPNPKDVPQCLGEGAGRGGLEDSFSGAFLNGNEVRGICKQKEGAMGESPLPGLGREGHPLTASGGSLSDYFAAAFGFALGP